jgi:tRNA (cmo5U34)-methyltransferase
MALLASYVGEHARVLVVGAGSGSEVVTFGTGMPGWTMTGIDPSDQMLQKAKFRVWQLELADRVELRAGYVEDLPDEAVYDAATLLFVMHFLPDDGAKQKILNAIASRLRPGAPLVLVDINGQPGDAEFDTLMRAWMSYVVHKGMNAEEQNTYRQQLHDSVHYVTEDRILELLMNAGFDRVTRFYGALLFGGWIAERAE